MLNPLTSKEAETNWPGWSMDHQMAFDRIKALVCSRECLIVVDRDALEDNSIFVSCDASDLRTGAMLSLGPSLETARPVTFESPPLVGAELRYPTHERNYSPSYAPSRSGALTYWVSHLLSTRTIARLRTSTGRKPPASSIPVAIIPWPMRLRHQIHQEREERCRRRALSP